MRASELNKNKNKKKKKKTQKKRRKKKKLFHTIKAIFSTCFCRFSKILNFPEFSGIFFIPANFLERIGSSRNSGYFLQSEVQLPVFTSLNGVTDLSVDNVKSVGLELKIWVVGSFLSFDLHVDINVTVL